MSRSYADWENDARTTTKSVTVLGGELRDRWDDWKHDSPYEKWEDCILGELGITAHALHIRESKARKAVNDSVSKGETIEPPRPPRINQQTSTLGERDRRREIVEDLWGKGYTRPNISEAIGVSEGTIQVDLAAAGLGGKRAVVRSDKPEPPRWRNQDLGITEEESTIEVPSFAACDTPSATEAIEDVRVQLALILGSRYRLSLKDRNNLITILIKALERARNGSQEENNGSRLAAHIAG